MAEEEVDAPEQLEAPPSAFDLRDPSTWTNLEALKERVLATSPMMRLIALTCLSLLGVGAWLLSASSNVAFETLYSGLSDDDRVRIVERLGRQGIPFEIEDGAVLVPDERVHDVRLMLAGEGLPRGGASGFELFDEQRFGESEFTEQVQYHRALEGELSRTISHLAGVENARVHLVLPERSLFVERDGQASASVVMHLAAGWRVNAQQAAGIVHLVASSVRGLNAEDVTLVDGEGRAIEQADQDGSIGDALAYRQRLERDRERSLQALLDETLGAGVARVEVSAEINLRREERTEERYLPDEVAPRSFQIEEERDADGAGGAAGIPGAASNLPGGAGNEAQAQNPANLRRRSETRNFEVSKTVRHAVEPVGTLARQSIAVVVDGTWEGETFAPRSDEELARIETIARAAAGFSETRGDTLSVTCVPFSRAGAEGPVDPLADLRPYLPYLPYLLWLLGILAVPLVLFLARRAWKKRQLEAEEEEKAAAAALESGSDEQTVEASELSADSVRNMLLGSGKEDEAEVAGEVQSIAAELAAEDPIRAARVLRGWLLEDVDEDAESEGAEKEEAAA
ncbi:MAG: flagellar basal-body MS-ring/collar protein FliF [Myxococcota bacterium]